MKEKINTTLFETVPKSNRIIIDRGKIDTSHTKLLHDHSFSWLGIGTTIKVAELGQGKKIISFPGQFPNILMRQRGTFFLL
jgi:hypothetical protein